MENQISTPIQTPPSKKNNWFGKIETREEALKVIKDSSNGFYFLAVLQIVIGYFLLGASAIVDGVIFAVLAFLLRKFNSMVVAILLLLLSIAGIIVTGINRFGSGSGGGPESFDEMACKHLGAYLTLVKIQIQDEVERERLFEEVQKYLRDKHNMITDYVFDSFESVVGKPV